MLNLKKPLAFFDLEATGISITNDRIVEICILKVSSNQSKEVKTWLVNPEMPIPEKSSKIHGIRDEDVKDAPTFKMIAKDVERFLDGADLAGFNIMKFDIPMLVEAFLRVDIDFSMKSRKVIDSQKIFHLMEPRTLSAAYKFYCNEELENAHSAEADTLATYDVLVQQVERYKEVAVKTKDGKLEYPVKNDMEELNKLVASNTIDYAGRMIYDENKVPVFNFGKYRHKPILEVLKKDPSYYDWIQKGDFPLDTKKKLMELKLSQLQLQK